MVEVDEMINNLVDNAHSALSDLETFDQSQVDSIVDAMVQAGLDNSAELAKLAHEETGRGNTHDKTMKNIFASGQVGNFIKNHKTVGIIDENDEAKTVTIAEPLGVLAGVTPVTNPTSTTLFKAIIAMKTRNPIIFSFHPQAMKSSMKAAEVVLDAAVKAGAPMNSIQWISEPSIQATNTLIKHPGVATILATGGPAMVEAAYSSGKPALGVGPGNAPLYVEKSADLDAAVKDIVLSKTFDNGMICATENSLVIDSEIYDDMKKRLSDAGVFFIDESDQDKLAQTMFNPETGGVNGPIAGRSAKQIADMAGIEVPEDTKVLAAELNEVGIDHLLSGEKLSPVVSVYKVDDLNHAYNTLESILNYGGLGHTAGIRSTNSDLITQFGLKMKACRILVNTPCCLGGVGSIVNGLEPSLTLGTGSWGFNSISHNVTDSDLLNLKKIAYPRENSDFTELIKKYM
ncbi:Aldehyde-alcohol dehydrogenase [Apilactobacillus kunkeei]|nr:Aldehyde-alcohol dehydrogenase [Apilactobacillus kunkeei]